MRPALRVLGVPLRGRLDRRKCAGPSTGSRLVLPNPRHLANWRRFCARRSSLSRSCRAGAAVVLQPRRGAARAGSPSGARADHRQGRGRRHDRADRHGPGADRDQPVVPDRRPAARAQRERRRHGAPGPAASRGSIRRTRRAACSRRAPSSPRPARNWSRRATTSRACATWSPKDAVSRAQFDQAEAMQKTGRVAGRVGAVAGDAGREPAELHAPRRPTSPAWSRRAAPSPAKWSAPDA